ncbi:MAG: VanZ family protein [Acidimicrobiia bacterium]|nr:VanZ family protein [Acidimicrobiia bacterium]
MILAFSLGVFGLRYYADSLSVALSVCVIIAFAMVAVASRRHRADEPWRDSMAALARPTGLAMSLAVIVVMTVYNPFHEGMGWWNGEGERYFNGNLIPLRTIRLYLASTPSRTVAVQLLGNVLLFVPLGFFLAYGGKQRFLKVFAIGVAVAVLVEALQFFVGGSVDIDDVILNSLGGVVGATIAMGVHRVTRRGSDGVDAESRVGY